MAIVGEYHHTWMLELSTRATKTVSAAFHLNNKEATRELKVNHNSETLSFCSEPKYLGARLNRSLTYRRNLESFRKEVTSCFALLRRLARSGWGFGATSLRTTTLAMVHSTVENCSPAEYHSAHTRLFDPATNNALRTVAGCLRPIPVDNLHILAGNQSAELRRKGATTLSLTRHGMEPGHCSTQQSLVHRVGITASQIKTRICTRCTSSHQFI